MSWYRALNWFHRHFYFEISYFSYEKRRRMILRHQHQTKCLLAVTLRLLETVMTVFVYTFYGTNFGSKIYQIKLATIYWVQDKIKRHVLIGKACSWTIVGNMFGKCHDPCMLKTSFVDFENEEAYCFRYKRLIFSSILNSPCLFSGS
jgi:hypothetical protein